jgi:hypothetical protein
VTTQILIGQRTRRKDRRAESNIIYSKCSTGGQVGHLRFFGICATRGGNIRPLTLASGIDFVHLEIYTVGVFWFRNFLFFQQHSEIFLVFNEVIIDINTAIYILMVPNKQTMRK